MDTTKISFKDLGMKEQSDEFYAKLNALFVEMDDMDLARTMFYLSNQIVKEEIKLPPLAIIAIMELLQNTEIMCAKLKKMMGDTELDGVTCKKCNNCLPKMTILQHLSGINKDCPHDSIEVVNERK